MLIPKWVIGKRVTAFTLTPQNVAADGTLSDASAQSLVGLWDEIDLDFETETEEISAGDALFQNTVILKDGLRLRFSQILKDGAPGAVNPLATLYYGADVFRLNLTRGPNSWAIYVARTAYSERVRKGKSTGDFTGAIVGLAPGYA